MKRDSYVVPWVLRCKTIVRHTTLASAPRFPNFRLASHQLETETADVVLVAVAYSFP